MPLANRLLIALAFLASLSVSPRAQSHAFDKDAQPIAVFIDCANCDDLFSDKTLTLDDYFRQELGEINYVRDRLQADVHVLISWQPTGSGGTEFMMELIGQGRFNQMRDTLVHVANETDTDDMIRAGLLSNLKIGLVRYVARTSQADQLRIGYVAPEGTADVAEPHDPWNYWVFNLGVATDLNGEKHYNDQQWTLQASATRVTDNWQFYVGGWYQHYKQEFEWQDGETGDWYSATSKKSAWNATSYAVKSLTDHWSAAVTTETNHSTFSNFDLWSSLSLSLEYNIFPYSQSSRRMLRIEYYLAVEYVDYIEETVYFETEEVLGSQRLSATADIIQPWGTLTSQVSGRHYTHEWDKYRIWWTSQASLRIIEGLSANIQGQVQWIHDQLYLPREGATPEETLTRQKALQTSYQYGLSVGLSYSFGSIYNNVVNRRFGG